MSAAPTIKSLILDGAKRDRIAEHIDTLDDRRRVAEIYELNWELQDILWSRAADGPPMTLEDFIPDANTTTVYRGRNSMPAFTRFEKVFYRPSDVGLPLGYNNQFWISFTGPGYFTTRAENGLIVFDYTTTPGQQLEGWPPLMGNDATIGGQVVFAHMVDYNRWVSKNTIIGFATKKDQPIGQYYCITRVTV